MCDEKSFAGKRSFDNAVRRILTRRFSSSSKAQIKFRGPVSQFHLPDGTHAFLHNDMEHC